MISASAQQVGVHMIIKRILVPVDFSADSLQAVAHASDLARHFGAAIVLLHVVEPTYLAQSANLYVANPELAALVDDQWHMGNRQLTRLGARLEKQGLQIRLVVASGVTARVIVKVARRRGAHLIVMGTHGRTGLRHLLIGSVAEKVVHTARCPVLTVRVGVTRATRRRNPERRRPTTRVRWRRRFV